jgi:integrase
LDSPSHRHLCINRSVQRGNDILSECLQLFSQRRRSIATKGVERPRKKQSERIEAMEFYSSEELKAMREAAGPDLTNALEFLAFSGCRVGEMRGIRTSDMEPARRVVRVTGKGSKTRPLTLAGPLSPAWDALEREARRRGVEDGRIFRQYVHFSYKGLVALLADLGIPKQRPVHAIRHTFASFALKSGWPIGQLAKWLGHSDIVLNTTYSIYGHLIAEEPPDLKFE